MIRPALPDAAKECSDTVSPPCVLLSLLEQSLAYLSDIKRQRTKVEPTSRSPAPPRCLAGADGKGIHFNSLTTTHTSIKIRLLSGLDHVSPMLTLRRRLATPKIRHRGDQAASHGSAAHHCGASHRRETMHRIYQIGNRAPPIRSRSANTIASTAHPSQHRDGHTRPDGVYGRKFISVLVN
jgi:hypothetical protein